MSSFHECKKCHRLVWTVHETHQCWPIEFHRNGYDSAGEWGERYFSSHYDHEIVAQKLAEADFYEDPGNLSSYEFDVTVRIKGIEKRFVVTGEPDIHWSTKPKPDEAEGVENEG